MSDDAAQPAPMPRRPVWLPGIVRFLVFTSAALLGLGLVAPAMHVSTSFGRYDGWVRLVANDLVRQKEATYSLLGGIVTLIRGREAWVGWVLLAFSVIFPTLKLATMAGATETLARGGRGGLFLAFAHHAGKFSMLDVLVVALLILAVKGLPGASDLRSEWGLWAFAASVLLSLIASLLLSWLESVARRRGEAIGREPQTAG